MFNTYNVKFKIKCTFTICFIITLIITYINFFFTPVELQIICNAIHPYKSNFISSQIRINFFKDFTTFLKLFLHNRSINALNVCIVEINNVLSYLNAISKHSEFFDEKLKLNDTMKEIIWLNQKFDSYALFLNNIYFDFIRVQNNLLNNNFEINNEFKNIFRQNKNIDIFFNYNLSEWNFKNNYYIEDVTQLIKIYDSVIKEYKIINEMNQKYNDIIFENIKTFLFNNFVIIVCKINYILLIINNLYDINFFFMTVTTIFIFIVYYNEILIYKTINLYMFLLYLVTMFSFFGLNPYIGFLVLVELMTITYITILVLNFTNYFSFTNKNKFNKYVIYLMFIIYPCLADYYLIFWVSDDLIFSYYDFYDFILTNDFVGIYIYLYFDNVLFTLNIALSFILFSLLFIKIIFVSFIEKIKIISLLGDKLVSFFYEFRVNFYEKNFFWEKDFFNVVNFFK